MTILVDMNLSPRWVPFLQDAGFVAQHWSKIGAADADDIAIFHHAITEDFVIFTNNLDFSTILFHTREKRPSVVQLRVVDLRPEIIGNWVVQALRQCDRDLKAGVILTLLPNQARIRKLPL